jgi:chemotaxis protein histidine kinase CheA
VIKSIEENDGSVPAIAAATILGNGRVAFIVDKWRVAPR